MSLSGHSHYQGFYHTNFTGDRRHVNPMLDAILYRPVSPEAIYTPPRKQRRSTDSIRSQSSFASTISLFKRTFRRGKH